jgi:hypothetical protein
MALGAGPADNARVAPPVKAIYVPPGRPARASAPRELRRAPKTYRLRLERETSDGAGETLYTWSGIPHERIGPLIQSLAGGLPWLARAAAAKDALGKLIDLFR